MTLKTAILERIQSKAEPAVWTAIDFLDLGDRDAIDKVFQRLVKANKLRRIDRGLYDKPKTNSLTGLIETPDYQKIIEAIARRDQFRMLIDGLTCANDLGLTNAVPGQVVILTDGRLRSIKIQNLTIKFKHTAPSKLYWADKPAMRIVQALYWLRDVVNSDHPIESRSIKNKLTVLLKNSKQKTILLTDLYKGLYTLPSWMQIFLKDILFLVEKDNEVENE